MAFIKKVEDFVCEMCGESVTGTGFTDHCSNCLWSKHVDIDPGDRKGDCGGLMEPIEISKKKGEERLLNKCKKCGFERWSRIAKTDNYSAVLGIVSKRNNALQ